MDLNITISKYQSNNDIKKCINDMQDYIRKNKDIIINIYINGDYEKMPLCEIYWDFDYDDNFALSETVRTWYDKHTCDVINYKII